MKIAATIPLRNEAWIAGLSLRAALLWCDVLVILLHDCCDDTKLIVESVAAEYPERVCIIEDYNPIWTEMAHRQQLLEEARKVGATHIALVDADEVLTGNLLSIIREQAILLQPGNFLCTRMFAIWRNLFQYRTDQCEWSNRKDFSLLFADIPGAHWALRDGGYDHHHRLPFGISSRPSIRLDADGGVMHLQWASWRRLVAKHALYKATERVRWPDRSVSHIEQIYSSAVNEQGLSCSPTKPEWWEPYRHWLSYANLEHEPWQERACRDIVAQHGVNYFKGLNFFGVC